MGILKLPVLDHGKSTENCFIIGHNNTKIKFFLSVTWHIMLFVVNEILQLYSPSSLTSHLLNMQPPEISISCSRTFTLFDSAFGIFSGGATVFTYSVRQFKGICRVKSLLTS